jgi:hypothetical protein
MGSTEMGLARGKVWMWPWQLGTELSLKTSRYITLPLLYCVTCAKLKAITEQVLSLDRLIRKSPCRV